MKLPARLQRAIDSIREMVGRMTPAQRVSFAMLGAVILIGVLTLTFTRSSDSTMVPYPGPLKPEVTKFLDENGFAYETNEAGRLQVRQKDLQSILSSAVAAGADDKEPDFTQWLYGEIGFNDTTGRMNLRMNDSQRRALESTLAKMPGVESSKVFFNKKEQPFRITEDNSSTASIQLVLERGTTRLNSRSARAAAKIVAGALGIPLARVTVTDNIGNEYKLDDNTQLSLEGRQEREREMANKISGAILDGDYAPGEYLLSVNLTVNSTKVKESTLAYNPDTSVNTPRRVYKEEFASIEGASQAPGTKPNVSGFTNAGASHPRNTQKRDETEFNNSIGMSQIEKETPSGDEQHWNVVAKVSKPAVIRRLRQEKELAGVNDWKPTSDEIELGVTRVTEKLRGEIETLLNAKGEQNGMVTATVGVFIPAVRETAALEERPSALIGFATEHAKEMVLATLGLVAIFLLYRLAAGRTHEMEKLPDPVAELAAYLERREQDHKKALVELAKQEGEAPAVSWDASAEDKRDIELLKEISKYTRERPEIAAVVLRHWIGGGDEDGAGDRVKAGADAGAEVQS